MKQLSNNLRIHIYVQHLLGAGHLVRMRVLADCLAHAGHQVTLLCGGVPIGRHHGNYEFVQLPAVKTAQGDFTVLQDQNGCAIDQTFKEARTKQLLARVQEDAPQVLVVETFPFGRRALRFELVPLMQMVLAMTPRPLRLCSVRDILQTRSVERNQQTMREIETWFDYVMVHADSEVVSLGDSFPPAPDLADKVFYSGYLYHNSAHHNSEHELEHDSEHDSSHTQTHEQDHAGYNEVLVSAGGGAVGFRLLQTAIAARAHSALSTHKWRLLVGANMHASDLATLQQQVEEGIIIERNRDDFALLLSRCALSVSQAGYNTVLDVVAAKCRSVLVPFSSYGETEQLQRAEKFASLGLAVVLTEQQLTPMRLAAAVDAAAKLALPQRQTIDLQGASHSLSFIEHCMTQRQDT